MLNVILCISRKWLIGNASISRLVNSRELLSVVSLLLKKKKITSLQKRDKLRQDMHKATIYHKHPLRIVEEGEHVVEYFLFLFLSRKFEEHFLNCLVFLFWHNLSPFSKWTLMSQGAVFYRVRSAPAHTPWIKRLRSLYARPLAHLPESSRNSVRSKWEQESCLSSRFLNPCFDSFIFFLFWRWVLSL